MIKKIQNGNLECNVIDNINTSCRQAVYVENYMDASKIMEPFEINVLPKISVFVVRTYSRFHI
jgi:hypothetical protein